MICRWLLFSRQVMSDSSQPSGLQYTKLPCPSLSPGVCPSSCPLNWWCHPAISSCHPLFLLPSIFPSIRVISSESAVCIRWPKYQSFSFSITLSNEYSRLISFKIDCFDVLAFQGNLNSLLQHHSLKALILWHFAFFIVHLSYAYVITGKIIALTIWTFVCKVMSLIFNTLSRFVMAFLARAIIFWFHGCSHLLHWF